MIEDLGIATSHFEFLKRYGRSYDSLSSSGKAYFISVKKCVILELKYLITDNHPHLEIILTLYLKSRIFKLIFPSVFNTRRYLTTRIIALSWKVGNLRILNKCLELEVDIDPSSYLSTAIRSGKPAVLDFCVENGGDIYSPGMRPYLFCRSSKMMKHIHSKYGCFMHDRLTLFSHKKIHLNDLYLKLGGTIKEMGSLNKYFNKTGNIERSLPLRKGFIRSKRDPINYTGLGRVLLLPGPILGMISEYM